MRAPDLEEVAAHDWRRSPRRGWWMLLRLRVANARTLWRFRRLRFRHPSPASLAIAAAGVIWPRAGDALASRRNIRADARRCPLQIEGGCCYLPRGHDGPHKVVWEEDP